MTDKPISVVVVPGEFVDGSSWQAVHRILTQDGYEVFVVQRPTVTLAGDVALTRRAVEISSHPVILVGHSYGGVVITEAGNDPKVRGLGFVAAFVPDAGESMETLISAGPPAAPLLAQSPDGFLSVAPDKFASALAADVDPALTKFMADAQVPWGPEPLISKVVSPAWKSKPSYYLIAVDDRMIPPRAQRQMAQRAGATIVESAGSHFLHVSHPDKVAKFITRAARRFEDEPLH